MKQILVAGIGNAWMRDDGFGGEGGRAPGGARSPEGAVVSDFGTGGLDLAYEVMRGYDELILVDISRQGGEPGTLYVMEPDEQEVAAGIEDGEAFNPHGMDPETVLRFVSTVGAGRARSSVVACEPAVVEEMGIGLSDEVRGGGGRRRRSRGRRSLRGRRSRARALDSRRDRRHRVKHAAGRRVKVVTVRAGALRQVVPDSLEFYFGFVDARDVL